jgi:hypothetical protein
MPQVENLKTPGVGNPQSKAQDYSWASDLNPNTYLILYIQYYQHFSTQDLWRNEVLISMAY